MGTNHDLVEFFFVHTSLIYYGLHTNPSFGAGLPDFKRTYLRPQEELENVLTIQIEPEFSALSVYEVFRAIPALLPYQNNDFRGVNKKTSTLCPLKKIIAIYRIPGSRPDQNCQAERSGPDERIFMTY